DGRKWNERARTGISSFTLNQEWLVVKVAGNNRESRRSVSELECEHGRVVLTRQQSTLGRFDCAMLVGHLNETVVTLREVNTSGGQEVTLGDFKTETSLIAS